MSGGEVSPVALAPVLSGAVGGLEVNVLGDRNPRGIPSMVFIVRPRWLAVVAAMFV